MSVSLDAPVRRREWGGVEDRRLPIGMWESQGVITGDATGGSAAVNLVFQPAAAPTLDGNLYSLEQLAIQVSEANARTARVATGNMGNLGGALTYAVDLQPVGGVGVAAMLGRDMDVFRGLFLGSAILTGSRVLLGVTLINTDTVLLIVQAEGYIWGSRSRSVLGGPQRPPAGLYR